MRKNKIKRILSIVMLTVVTTSLSACGSKKEENVTVHSDVSFPLEETATLTMLTSAPAVSEQNPNNRLIFKRLQEKTNVEVDWTCYPDDQYGDKKSLALSKKDTLPDVVFNAGMSNYDLLRYSKQGVIIAVEDLIDEYMPNLSKILNEKQPLSVKDLDINGYDLIKLGYKGREIGEMLDILLASVLESPELNSREVLLQMTTKWTI